MELVFYNCAPQDAAKITSEILVKGLAANVSAIPGVQRRYYQQDDIQQKGQTMLLIYTRKHLLNPLFDLLASSSSDQPPPIMALGMSSGYKPSVDWLTETLPKNGAQGGT